VNSDTPTEYEVLRRLAEDLHKSRLFKTGSVEQALAVVLMGRELGIGPTTALSNIVIAAGKPTLGAALVGALVQKSGKYGYQVTELSDQQASVDFFQIDTVNLTNAPGTRYRHILGNSTFTLQDAQRARLAQSQTWQQYPRNLLLARAITNGARWYCPEVFGGAIYDPDELGIAGSLAPPEGEDTTGSAPDASPSEGAVDAEFTPNGDGAIDLERLMEMFSADEIVAANDGEVPSTDEEVLAVYRRLKSK
jgi:hypothetical protein